MSPMFRLLARIGAGALTAALLAAPLPAFAAYPDHPIKLIVPVPPGGGVDILSRAIGAKMSQSMGQPIVVPPEVIVVENKAGASAAIGTDLLAKSPADGYTIMMGYSAHATNPIFVPKLPYDTNKDFAAIAHVGYIPLILVVNASSPYMTVQDLIAAARAKPGSVASPAKYATAVRRSASRGSSPLILTSPVVGVRHPISDRSSVVLPAPLLPITPRHCPAPRSKDTLARTSLRPYRSVSSRTDRATIIAPPPAGCRHDAPRSAQPSYSPATARLLWS